MPECAIEPVTSISVSSVDSSLRFIDDQRNSGTDLETTLVNCDKEGLQLLGGNINDSKLKSCDNLMQNISVTEPIKTTETMDKIAIPSLTTLDSKPGNSHSRQGSCASSSSTFSENGQNKTGTIHPLFGELESCLRGNIVGLHRKMVPQEAYFLSTEKYRPVLFGLPIVVSCSDSTTYQDLYKSVWVQVSRLVSPLPPKDKTQNHATDCDDSLGYEYPFLLKVVQKGGSWCAWCPWHRFCRGCTLPCTSDEFSFAASNLAIDWDQTALHLRYLSAEEKAFVQDPSVPASLKAATEPITLNKCLEAFTRQEELGDGEKYYCPRCKSHQLASKKLQIWRLPPILIVHLKRFHYLNGRWLKSHKIVDFPVKDYDPTHYLAAVPCNTIQRYKELVEMGKTSSARVTKARNIWKNCNGVINEANEIEDKINEYTQNTDAQFTENILLEIQNDSKCTADIETCCNGDRVQYVPESPRSEELSCDSNLCDMGANNLQVAEKQDRIFSPNCNRRMRQESTSLYTHPITDDDLQDFHQHRLLPGRHPLDIRYNLYSMVVSIN